MASASRWRKAALTNFFSPFEVWGSSYLAISRFSTCEAMSFQQVSGQSEVTTYFSSGGQWFQPSGSRTVTGVTAQRIARLPGPG